MNKEDSSDELVLSLFDASSLREQGKLQIHQTLLTFYLVQSTNRQLWTIEFWSKHLLLIEDATCSFFNNLIIKITNR